MSVDDVRHEFEHHNSLWTVRSDLRKQKALEWVTERVVATDEDGEPVDVTTFEDSWNQLIEELSNVLLDYSPIHLPALSSHPKNSHRNI